MKAGYKDHKVTLLKVSCYQRYHTFEVSIVDLVEVQ